MAKPEAGRRDMAGEIRIITFDLDDTLWAMKPVMVNAERKVYEWLGHQCPELTARYTLRELAENRFRRVADYPGLRHQVSALRRLTLRDVLLDAGYSKEAAERLAEDAFEVFLAARHEVAFFAHALETLAALSRHYLLGALTNGNADVKRLGLDRYFSFAYRAEELNSSKPAPTHFERALKVTGATPAQAIHVGDDPEHDIVAARRLGWHAIWFNREGLAWEDETTPTATVGCLSALADAIAAIDRP